MSFWEIGIKIKKNKLSIPVSTRELIQLYSENNAVQIVDVTTSIMLKALDLKWAHNDPIDRIIVSTAIVFNTSIVSGDSIIADFYQETIL